MQCPACHEPVAVWVAFCPHCGARQGTGAEQSAAEAPSEAIPAAEAHDQPSLTAELFGAPLGAAADPPAPHDDPEAYAAAPVTEPAPVTESTPVLVAHEPIEAAQPTAAWPGAARRTGEDSGFPPAAAEPAWTQWEDEEPPRKGLAPWLIGAAAALVVLTLGFVVWSFVKVEDGSQASNSPIASTTTSPRATPGQSSAAPSANAPATPSPTPSSPSPSPSTTPAGPLPEGAAPCGVTGIGDTAAVFAGGANTSCPFALEVASAYRAADSKGAPASITAKSPVTGKDYTLVCTGTLPTTCTTDSGATVYVTREG